MAPDCVSGAYLHVSLNSQILATPVLLAASATAFETAGQTLGSNAFGMM